MQINEKVKNELDFCPKKMVCQDEFGVLSDIPMEI